MASENTFINLLQEHYEKKHNSNAAVIKEKLNDMFFFACTKLSHCFYLDSLIDFYEILQFVNDNGKEQCGLSEEEMYILHCYYCYSYNMNASDLDNSNNYDEFYINTAENMSNMYPTWHFPMYLLIQEKYKKKEWLLCIYYCDLWKQNKTNFIDNKYNESPYYDENIIPEMDLKKCLTKIKLIEECCNLGYLEKIFENVDNKYVEEFMYNKKRKNFGDIEEECMMAFAFGNDNSGQQGHTAAYNGNKNNKIDKWDFFNMLLSRGLNSQKSVHTQTHKLPIKCRGVQTDTIKRKSIGLQKRDEEVQQKTFEEKKLIKKLEKQLLEKEIEIKILKERQIHIEEEKNRQTVKNVLLQKVLLQDAADKFILYTSIYNNMKELCTFMLNNITEIGNLLTSNMGLNQDSYAGHFDSWLAKSANVSKEMEHLNVSYKQMKVNMIQNEIFTTTWPSAAIKILDERDVEFIFKDFKKLIQTHLQLDQKLLRTPPKPAPQALGYATVCRSDGRSSQASAISEASSLEPCTGSWTIVKNISGNKVKKKQPNQQYMRNSKPPILPESYFEYIWKSFPGIDDNVVTRAVLEVSDKHNGSLAQIPKPTIIEEVREILRKYSGKEGKKRSQHVDDDDNGCPICLDPLLPRNQYILPCKHVFHKNCIKTWLRNNNECPICREKISNSVEYPPL